MVDAGIEDKDLVVIRKQDTASVGDIVVALDEDSQNTLKTFAGIDDYTGYAVLVTETALTGASVMGNENAYITVLNSPSAPMLLLRPAVRPLFYFCRRPCQ